MAGSTPQPLWRILIVEDDPVINVMLQDMLVKLRCMAVGPAGSVAAALNLIETTPLLDGAVLDCDLGGEKVWQVADRLVERRVPFVFSTGYGQAGITARFAGVVVLNKPYSVRALERALMPQLSDRT
jgi:CheY-like chemotaxis protein